MMRDGWFAANSPLTEVADGSGSWTSNPPMSGEGLQFPYQLYDQGKPNEAIIDVSRQRPHTRQEYR
jgi:hypothetical protein